MYVRNGTGILKRVLVSPPEYLNPAPINEIAKKWQNSRLDVDKMMEEFSQFVGAYRKEGIEVEVLESSPERPNAVFARDFGGCIREGYILGRFKFPLREREHTDYAGRMKKLGIPVVARCRKGLFEGGDFVFLRENQIVLGMADRTNPEGVLEIREQLAPLGYRVTGVPLKKEYLHMDMCFNLVDEHLAVGYREGMPESFLNLLKKEEVELIPVSEEEIFQHGCNLQSLGGRRVISLKKNEYVNEELEKRGMKVIALDLEEILKAGGGPHCMTFPLLRE